MELLKKHSGLQMMRNCVGENALQKFFVHSKESKCLGLEFQAHADLVTSLLEVLAVDQSRQIQSHA